MSRNAFFDVMRQANVSKRVTQELQAALLAAQLPGGSPEDVAACLLRWSGRHARSLLANVEGKRRRAQARKVKGYLQQQVDTTDRCPFDGPYSESQEPALWVDPDQMSMFGDHA